MWNRSIVTHARPWPLPLPPLLILFALLALLTTLLPLAHPAQAATTQLSRAGRYYQIDGQYRFLSAYDTQELHADTSVDYRAKLDTIQHHGIRKIRLWLYPYWNPQYLAPWTYINGRYNLDQWNDAYWSRLRDIVREAQARGIVVEVSLFTANVVDEAKDWTNTTYRPAWNRDFNVNGAFGGNGSGHFVPQFFQVGYGENGRGLFATQQQLLMKAINELRDFPNVLIEICNEWPGNGPSVADTYAWQQTMANEVRNRTSQLVVVHAHRYTGDHTDGLEHFGGMASVDVLNFHTGTDPNVLSRVLAPAWNYGKPIQSNEGADPYADVAAVTRGAWGYLLAGGASYAAYEDKAGRIGSSQWAAGAQRLRVLAQLAEQNQFWVLSPFDSSGNQIDNLITATPGSDWQLIAGGGRYLAYVWNSPTTTALRINLPSGSYSYSWYDPRTGNSLGSGSVSGSSSTSIPAPNPGSWAGNEGLVLSLSLSSSAPAPQPTAAPPPAAAPPSGGSQPYSGSPIPLPGTIALRDYDRGGEGVAYHDTDAQNQGGAYRPTEGVDLQSSSEGGHNIGWVKAGEWVQYTVNVQQAGEYTLTLRSAGNGSGGRVQVTANGRSATLSIPKTPTWQTYADSTARLYLDAGSQIIRLDMAHSDPNQQWVGNLVRLTLSR